MNFTKEQHKIWNKLITTQLPNVEKSGSEIFLRGLESIKFPVDKVPSLKFLNSRITPKTGWKILRTGIRYTDSLPWYQHFLKKEFLISDYLRSWEEFEYTHEPDMFHDIFGHLPYHTLPEYTELIEMFAEPFLRADDQQREDIKKLAWFSYEFGLIKEKGKLKAFGTGLLSSIGELNNVVAGNTPIIPFTIEKVLTKSKAIYTFNEQLFVFESLDTLKAELKNYFDSIPQSSSELPVVSEIKEVEMKM